MRMNRTRPYPKTRLVKTVPFHTQAKTVKPTVVQTNFDLKNLMLKASQCKSCGGK